MKCPHEKDHEMDPIPFRRDMYSKKKPHGIEHCIKAVILFLHVGYIGLLVLILISIFQGNHGWALMIFVMTALSFKYCLNRIQI